MSVKQNLSPGRYQADYQALTSTTDYIWDTLHGNSTKTSRSGELLHETAKMCFSKKCVNFGRCYGNHGLAEAFEKSIIVLKISSFKFAESFKSVAQGVLEIFEQVYMGGGGGAQCVLVLID